MGVENYILASKLMIKKYNLIYKSIPEEECKKEWPISIDKIITTVAGGDISISK